MIIHQNENVIAIAVPASSNRKTGESVQIWILDARMHPAESRASGADASNQCEGCPFASGRGCYVNLNPVNSIWRAYQRGSYGQLAMGSPEWHKFFSGKFVRFGAYGNPSLLPLAMVENISNLARKTTGYFHDWHLMPPALAKAYGRYLMASVENNNVEYARNLGLRVYRVAPSAPKESGFIECLAETRGITCAECGLCNGNFTNGKRPSIWIRPHGFQKRKAEAQSLA